VSPKKIAALASILLPIETKGREMKDVTPAQKNKAQKRPEPPAEFENPISFDQSADWTQQKLIAFARSRLSSMRAWTRSQKK
jgi:hypothetical protein